MSLAVPWFKDSLAVVSDDHARGRWFHSGVFPSERGSILALFQGLASLAICLICQVLVYGKNKKSISKCRLLPFTSNSFAL